ncbi:hypothetical protein [Streptomyces calidiresistens]|uniref:Uncharacterized protein n=1 Tax=Streptomyces calidiresistens TaxID=1485586 RepID=A0A7W3SZZ4_9ACTN|nr:hypothetical protein [Streptomyces calidiresistens]MBB0228361.1 hypothetical protein [Streptomyces calidiresistens]
MKRRIRPPAMVREHSPDRWRRGTCWLWCGRDDLAVQWLGTVEHGPVRVPLTAYRECTHLLTERVHAVAPASTPPTENA